MNSKSTSTTFIVWLICNDSVLEYIVDNQVLKTFFLKLASSISYAFFYKQKKNQLQIGVNWKIKCLETISAWVVSRITRKLSSCFKMILWVFFSNLKAYIFQISFLCNKKNLKFLRFTIKHDQFWCKKADTKQSVRTNLTVCHQAPGRKTYFQ